ncbi:GDSL-type esterase/lipase family protein [Saccharicrinis sp. FJH54]|uniref:SGNH/GDSL hydrolase family protein n=1 Tax=Saccharicrinis sp. FJH54 TaxID=3344665 RepID=UPI0035D4BF3A
MKAKSGFTGILFVLILMSFRLLSQDNPAWDDTTKKDWPSECHEITVNSTSDHTEQKAMFYAGSDQSPAPLIVSLHTWSGDYTQKDPLALECISKGFVYIHPDFRGANNKFDACGSSKVIQDIDDAIAYAIHHARVDTTEIHIVGVSGGGYATLLAYMNTIYPVKTFSAWVPISDLEAWFNESEGRKNKYARDIAICTTGRNFGSKGYYIDKKEAHKRSPLFMQTPVEKRHKAKLFIYTGIHDGYTGSVPVTQSLKFYNKVVRDFDATETEAIVPESDMLTLVASQNYQSLTKGKLGKRLIQYRKSYKDLIQLTVFEGTHEMLTDVALNPTESKNILAIGDSNGEFYFGWVTQLKTVRFEDFIYNSCISGNTIGYNNLNRPALNTLHNIDRYMDEAYAYSGKQDAIVIMLGTNDCKAVFTENIKNVPDSMRTLIAKIKAHPVYRSSHPKLFIVSPPPMNPHPELHDKYLKGNDRIKYLNKEFKKVAKEEGCVYINTYPHLEGVFDYVTIDGIHLKPEGQMVIAKIISEALDDYFKTE